MNMRSLLANCFPNSANYDLRKNLIEANMWEITIIGNEEDNGYFELIKEQINLTFGKDVIVAISIGYTCYCSIATEHDEYITDLKYLVVQTIIKISKIEFFLDNITILGNDIELNKFIIISLAHIGLEEECNYIISNIKIPNRICIRSFAKFKLARLEYVWNTTIKYLSKRLSGIDESYLYLEFLRFLANNCESKIDVVYVVYGQDSIQLLNDKKQIITCIPKNDEVGVVVNLILFAPKKLIVNCLGSISDKVAELISYIFEDRLSVIL
jgi:hypothetical protein